MKRKRIAFLTVGIMSLISLLTALGVLTASAHWPEVDVQLSFTSPEDNIFRYTIWVQNKEKFDLTDLTIRAPIPEGAKYVRSWAGYGPGVNQGGFDGKEVGWIHPKVEAGKKDGPFVYEVNTSPLPPNSRPFTKAWISWLGKIPGSALSNEVRIRTPYPFPAEKPSAARGKALYEETCARCHGLTGKGDGPAAAGLAVKPRNFTDTRWLREAGDRAMPFLHFLTITNGIPGRMEAFKDRLTEAQRWDILFYEWSLATSAEKLAQGKAIWQRNCVACHGETGKGDGPLAATLPARPPDFTDLWHMAREYSAVFFKTVTEGDTEHGMPSWEKLLTEEQRWNVVDYIRTFSYDPPFAVPVVAAPAAPAPPAAPPPPAVAGDVARGSAVYSQNCQACHGAEARGGIGPALRGVHFIEEHGTFDTLAEMVRGGSPPIMPAFPPTQISDEQLRDLLAYLLSLR